VVYRFFKRADGKPASVRIYVFALVAIACALCALGIVRVARQHEVLRLGYQLSRESESVRELREVRRRLELEHATLTSPDRIRHLATLLGMTPVPPDSIRVVDGHHKLAEVP
jgi:cell division protein FtsL